MRDPVFKTHQCLLAGTWKRAMLPTKRSAGVAPEVSIRECVRCMPASSVNEAVHSGKRDITRSPKEGCQWVHKNGQVSKN